MLQAHRDIGFQKVASAILFGPVDIAQLTLNLWLPTAVKVDVQTYGLLYQERHKYSNYRLYHVTARIISQGKSAR